MDLVFLIEWAGEDGATTLAGLAIGLAFGALAQRSKFCLRSAVIEFWRGAIGPKVAVWLLTFGAAVAGTQGLILGGALDVSEARQLANAGSLSGALIGGALFGSGMILSRGCASRLLILSANGNLRALVSGLILTVVAQASLRGILSPLREDLARLWMVDGGAARDLLAIVGVGNAAAFVFGIAILAVAVFFAVRNRVGPWTMIGAFGVGAMIAAGWAATYTLAGESFQGGAVKSISFIGPSADTLMAAINEPKLTLGFDLGLIPGVFAGSFFAAFLARDLKIECFSGDVRPMPRYIAGAVMMGFGGMLAGGCAVGAGITGGSVFALTAWVALTAMWVAGGLTDRLLDLARERKADAGHLAPAE